MGLWFLVQYRKGKGSVSVIRAATEQDAPALLEIYGHYVRHTAITYEYEVPTLENFQQRIRKTLTQYPYLVMEMDGKILGYAYAGRFHERRSFDWAAEATVYVHKDTRGQGIGPKLYAVLENCLRLQGYVNLNVSIAYPETEDEYLTKNSVAFHSHMGYGLCAHFHKCAYKFGRWYDLVWMEKPLCDHPPIPQPPKPFPEIRSKLGLS